MVLPISVSSGEAMRLNFLNPIKIRSYFQVKWQQYIDAPIKVILGEVKKNVSKESIEG